MILADVFYILVFGGEMQGTGGVFRSFPFCRGGRKRTLFGTDRKEHAEDVYFYAMFAGTGGCMVRWRDRTRRLLYLQSLGRKGGKNMFLDGQDSSDRILVGV